MFRLLFVYPLVLLVVLWLSSDVHISFSVHALKDNHISIEFPKASLRSSDDPNPWYSFYWNMNSTRGQLNNIKDSVVN